MKYSLFFLIGFCLLHSACSDPSTIGASLLGDEALIIEFTDTISVKGKTVRGDSLSILSRLSTSIGILDEPYFGKTENVFYMTTSFGDGTPNFDGSILDSAVLRIPYLRERSYGDSTVMHQVELFQLDRNILEIGDEIGFENLDSSVEIEFDEAKIIGELSLVPNYRDSMIIQSHINPDTSFIEQAHIRIPIDQFFARNFVNNPDNIINDTTYQGVAKGFALRTTPMGSSLMGLDLGNRNNHKMLYYYTKIVPSTDATLPDDTLKLVYGFDVAAFNHLHVNHEYDGSGSEVETALNDPSDDQEFLYLEGFAGTNVEFDLSGLKPFEDDIINHVLLEFTLADVPGYDYNLYPASEFGLLSTYGEDGNLDLISDIVSLGSSPSENLLVSGFGGKLEEVDGKQKYVMNITNHVVDLFNQDNPDFRVILSSFLRVSSVNRAIIHGNGNEAYAPKLKLVITKS